MVETSDSSFFCIFDGYEDVFPALPDSLPPKRQVAEGLPSFERASITTIVEIPINEQTNSPQDNKSYRENARVCSNIQKVCGVQIELSNSRHGTLNVIITGPADNVKRAKMMAIQELQQQSKCVLMVPRYLHKHIVGHQGQKRRDIEEKTLTKINVPPPSKNSNEIVIVGPPKNLEEAVKEINALVEFHSQRASEKLDIPKMFHPFISGPYGNTIEEIRKKTNAKVDIPPPSKSEAEIMVSGKKDDVCKAVAAIKKIYEDCERTHTTTTTSLNHAFHRMVVGPRRSGINEIFEKTGVYVELPSDPEADFLTLRGPADSIGKAVYLVYELACRVQSETVPAPQRLHRILIGKKGSALNSILEGYEGIKIDFSNSGNEIKVEGAPDGVAVVVERLKAKIADLVSLHHLEILDIDPKFHKKLTGNGSESIMQYIRTHRLNARLRSAAECGEPENERHIFVEGEESSVNLVKAEVDRLIKKWVNEKVKDLIVEPRIQSMLRSGNPPPIRQILDAYPEVELRWPQQTANGNRRLQRSGKTPSSSGETANGHTTNYVIQICGVRDKVDSAAEKLIKLVKQLQDENHEQEFRIFKDSLQRILGNPIRTLLKETQTRIRYLPPSEDGSQPVVIIGREADVESAVTRLEKMQRQLGNIQETTITLPTMMLVKQVHSSTTPGARLRSIREQCDGVQLKTSPSQPRHLTISGPPEAVEKAKALIDSMCSKMLERCADSIVYADPKFHGQLIGRGGVALKKFREKHDVEVLFPDRLESDPKVASEIHIIGEKDAVASAVNDLEQVVKAMEDETDASVTCDPSILKDIWAYRSAFQYPELERVKVIFPKAPTSPPTCRKDSNSKTGGEDAADTSIRIFGPKGCVEEAKLCIQNVIKDINSQVTRKQPVTEIGQFHVLSRLRSSLPEIQRNHHVLISLQLNKDGFHEKEDDALIYGYIVLTGTPDKIDAVLNHEIIPLLPISEVMNFPREFFGKLFMTEPQPNSNNTAGRRGENSKNSRDGRQHPAGRSVATIFNSENGSESHKTRLNALQAKYNVSINVPPRADPSSSQITIRGAPEAVEACKAELTVLEERFQAEKADREARNFEDVYNVEERYLNRLISGEKDKLFKKHGVAIFTRVRNAASVNTKTASSVGESPVLPANSDDNGDTGEPSLSFSDKSENERFVGYRLVSRVIVPLVLQGYKEKVALVRAELDALVEGFRKFQCVELSIPPETHPRLIGTRHSNIHRLEETYNVDVEFPPRGHNETSVVLVMGLPENVDSAADELINKANDILAELPDPKMQRNLNSHDKSKASPKQQPPNQSEFVVVGAPWDKSSTSAND